MTAAVAAMHLGARHAVAAIDGGGVAARVGSEEAGPAGTALELAIGDEALLSAPRARKRARPVFTQERARSGSFSGVIPQHRILLRCQQLAPLFVRPGDGKCRRFVHAPKYASARQGRTLPIERFLSYGWAADLTLWHGTARPAAGWARGPRVAQTRAGVLRNGRYGIAVARRQGAVPRRLHHGAV